MVGLPRTPALGSASAARTCCRRAVAQVDGPVESAVPEVGPHAEGDRQGERDGEQVPPVESLRLCADGRHEREVGPLAVRPPLRAPDRLGPARRSGRRAAARLAALLAAIDDGVGATAALAIAGPTAVAITGVAVGSMQPRGSSSSGSAARGAHGCCDTWCRACRLSGSYERSLALGRSPVATCVASGEGIRYAFRTAGSSFSPGPKCTPWEETILELDTRDRGRRPGRHQAGRRSRRRLARDPRPHRDAGGDDIDRGLPRPSSTGVSTRRSRPRPGRRPSAWAPPRWSIFAPAASCSRPTCPSSDVPLRDLLAERYGLPVAVDNDANVACLAEHRYGAGAA